MVIPFTKPIYKLNNLPGKYIYIYILQVLYIYIYIRQLWGKNYDFSLLTQFIQNCIFYNGGGRTCPIFCSGEFIIEAVSNPHYPHLSDMGVNYLKTLP